MYPTFGRLKSKARIGSTLGVPVGKSERRGGRFNGSSSEERNEIDGIGEDFSDFVSAEVTMEVVEEGEKEFVIKDRGFVDFIDCDEFEMVEVKGQVMADELKSGILCEANLDDIGHCFGEVIDKSKGENVTVELISELIRGVVRVSIRVVID